MLGMSTMLHPSFIQHWHPLNSLSMGSNAASQRHFQTWFILPKGLLNQRPSTTYYNTTVDTVFASAYTAPYITPPKKNQQQPPTDQNKNRGKPNKQTYPRSILTSGRGHFLISALCWNFPITGTQTKSWKLPSDDHRMLASASSPWGAISEFRVRGEAWPATSAKMSSAAGDHSTSQSRSCSVAH